ncbi:MAG: DoxX family membrane protein [Opitutaceae bacterium]
MNNIRIVLRWALALFFVAAGANHFRDPATYLGMMPPWLPWPEVANVVSGVAEVLGGVGLLVPATRRFAGWGLIALLVAIFPANLHVALQGHMPGHDFSPAVLWWRLPFQAGFIAAVWWVAICDRRSPPASSTKL